MSSSNIDTFLKKYSGNKNAALNFYFIGNQTVKRSDGRTYNLKSDIGHSLSITKITEKEITFIDPYNSSDEITMNIEEFKKCLEELPMDENIRDDIEKVTIDIKDV